ncbi:MAG TPA: hypothetical protein VH724_10530, partial [Candidatus Angelobacter sp.]|nr:hypothetical protein [Candidatus Angelobacter sp.]
MQFTRIPVVGSIALALLAAAVGYAQDSQAGEQQKGQQKKETVYQSQTVLRATTRLVVLDVVALDEKGQPILGLKADDFTVMEDGKPQKISDFSYHHPSSSRAPARALAPNVISNAPEFSANSCLNVILL